MTKLRQLWLLTAVGSLAVLAAGYFLLVSPKSNEASALRDDVETQLQANTKLKSQIAMLNKQKKDLPRLQAELEKFASRIPADDPGLPAFVRSLSDAAENAGAELVGVSPASPVRVQAAPTAGTVTAAAAAGPGLALAQIPVSVQVSGSYSQISQFFSEVEGLSRAFLITNVAVQPDKKAANPSEAGTAAVDRYRLSASLSGNLFMTTTAVAAPAPVKPVADETK
ncbi:MAG TPA: type 4a pilus biogenesis protein PilO [Mycobacteriales bacterium]|jgi:Tfp pilus assembly protein PilO|nr:type 4a pilus biogenesis protein PilO [Mycobacteriales bacterium]